MQNTQNTEGLIFTPQEQDQLLKQWTRALAVEDTYIMRRLIDGGAVNIASSDLNQTPLMLAAVSGNENITRALIAAGADVNAIDQDRKTALIFAAINNKFALIPVLCEAGADVNAMDHFGYTAIHHAVTISGRIPLLKALLEAGADPGPVYKKAGRLDPAVAEALLPSLRARMNAATEASKAALSDPGAGADQKPAQAEADNTPDPEGERLRAELNAATEETRAMIYGSYPAEP